MLAHECCEALGKDAFTTREAKYAIPVQFQRQLPIQYLIKQRCCKQTEQGNSGSRLTRQICGSHGAAELVITKLIVHKYSLKSATGL